MKISYNPFLQKYSLMIGCVNNNIRVYFDRVAKSEVRDDMIFLSDENNHTASICGQDVAEFTHELKLAEAAKTAREMGQKVAPGARVAVAIGVHLW